VSLSLDEVPVRPLPDQRLGRAALFAFSAAVATVGAGCTTSNPSGDASVDAYTAAGDTPVYGGPDMGPPPAPDTGVDGGGGTLYGAPPDTGP
jgi:hypothetical protein